MAGVERRSAQDVFAPAAFEPEQDVLGTAGQLHDIDDRAVAKALIVHPGGKIAQINQLQAVWAIYAQATAALRPASSPERPYLASAASRRAGRW